MSEWLSKTQVQWLMWRMAVALAILYSLDAIFTAVVSVMIGSEWHDLTPTDKFLRVMLIGKAWVSAMLALFTNASKRLARDEFPIGGGEETKTSTSVTMETTKTESKV